MRNVHQRSRMQHGASRCIKVQRNVQKRSRRGYLVEDNDAADEDTDFDFVLACGGQRPTA